MRFLIDSMLPPSTCSLLVDRAHEAITPTDLGAHNLPDGTLIEIAGSDGWVVATENAVDFAHATSCTVLLVRKDWWPSDALAGRLAESLEGWAHDHPTPGHWATGSTTPTGDHALSLRHAARTGYRRRRGRIVPEVTRGTCSRTTGPSARSRTEGPVRGWVS